MNSEGEYTLCNLDTHSYANSFTSPDLSNTIFANSPHPGYQGLGHATASPHRSLDTGQSGYHVHGYGGAHSDGGLGSGGELPLATAPQQLGGYPINTSALRAAATRHHAGASPYGHLPDLALATASDCYMNGGGGVNGNISVSGHNGQGMCMDISSGMRGSYPCPPDVVRGTSTPTSAYLQTPTTSPIKSEGCGGTGGGVQGLHNKPFRWMTIKRNAAKPGEFFSTPTWPSCPQYTHTFPVEFV